MGERAVDEVGEHGLDDGVAAVGKVSGGGRLGAGGEEWVVTPHREQFIAAGLVAYPSRDQTAGRTSSGEPRAPDPRGHRLGIVDGDEVMVSVTVHQNTAILSAFGVGSIEGKATSTATALHGTTTEG